MARRASPARREKWWGLGLLAPAFLVVTIFAFLPIADSIFLSLHRLILSLPQLGEPFVGLANFRRLLADPAALGSLVTTLIFVAVSTALEVLLGLAMALVLNRSFRGRGLARAAVLVPWAIPTVVSSQMWRFIMNDQYGLWNYLLFGGHTAAYQAWLALPGWALAAIIAADVWKTSSFAALIILAGLQGIPDELYEAARLDGAGPWQSFWRITLPLARPAILLALLFRTMDAFRVFDLVYVMTQGGPANATSVLQFYGYKKMFAEGFMGYGSAISVLVFAAVLLVALVYLRLLGRRMAEGERT
ncbi:MAG: sugar ABC transporter permease [Deltaproteobacteria bacterium]|nr:sugar ABC transporter permease [Deltaproteobacteria bacterium]